MLWTTELWSGEFGLVMVVFRFVRLPGVKSRAFYNSMALDSKSQLVHY